MTAVAVIGGLAVLAVLLIVAAVLVEDVRTETKEKTR